MRWFAVLVLSMFAATAVAKPLSEDAALALLDQVITRDRVYKDRIAAACITYETEETTSAYFAFVLREKHDAKCGGDPAVSPAIDRYRVYRNSKKIERYDVVNDEWQRYGASKAR